jgi:hypothetical protein
MIKSEKITQNFVFLMIFIQVKEISEQNQKRKYFETH